MSQGTIEKGAVVPIALVVHQFVHATTDDDSMDTTRGLLCAESATEDHEIHTDDERPF